MPNPGATAAKGDLERATLLGARSSSDAFLPVMPAWLVVLIQSGLFFTMSIVLETTRVLMRLVAQELGLSPFQAALTGSAVPFGGCLGAACGGLLSDAKGRRVSMLCFLSLMVVVCCSAWVLPLDFATVVALHACKGLCFGAVVASVLPWGAEHYATKSRGQMMSFTTAGWSLGSIVAFAALQHEALIGIQRIEFMPAIPAAASILLLLMAEESPRWRCLESTGWRLQEVFATQGSEIALHSLAWGCFSGGWYVLFFWGPELLRRRAGADGVDYAFFMWSAILTFPCFIVAALVMEYGRRPVFLTTCLLGTASVVPLASGSELTCKVMLVTSDFFTCIAWAAMAIHAAETFPTVYRASALGWLQFLARVSAGACPLLGGYLLHAAPEFVSLGIAAVLLVACVAIWLLPETAGLDLRDAVSRSPGAGETKPLLAR